MFRTNWNYLSRAGVESSPLPPPSLPPFASPSAPPSAPHLGYAPVYQTFSSKDCSVSIDESGPCNEAPMHRSTETQLKSLDRRNTNNSPTKLMSRPEEMMSCCQKIPTVVLFPKLTILMNTKPVLLKLTIFFGHMVLLLNGWVRTIVSLRFFISFRGRIRDLSSQSSRKNPNT